LDSFLAPMTRRPKKPTPSFQPPQETGNGANVLDDRVHVEVYVDMPPPSRHRLPMIDFKFCSEVDDDPALPPSCELLAEDV
jgi:hypothetical protein